MAEKGEMSNLKAWLLVLASLLDEAILLVLVFLGLKFFGVEITWPVILVVLLIVVVYFLVIHKAVIPALRRRKATGTESMVGLTGEVTQALNPQGIVMLGGEYWQAKSADAGINIGEEVEVVGVSGLVVEVKRKTR